MDQPQSLFTRCYQETQRQFPGSSPLTLKSLATRLHMSLVTNPKRRMNKHEVYHRFSQLDVALSTLPEIRGMRNGDRRPDNAED